MEEELKEKENHLKTTREDLYKYKYDAFGNPAVGYREEQYIEDLQRSVGETQRIIDYKKRLIAELKAIK